MIKQVHFLTFQETLLKREVFLIARVDYKDVQEVLELRLDLLSTPWLDPSCSPGHFLRVTLNYKVSSQRHGLTLSSHDNLPQTLMWLCQATHDMHSNQLNQVDHYGIHGPSVRQLLEVRDEGFQIVNDAA